MVFGIDVDVDSSVAWGINVSKPRPIEDEENKNMMMTPLMHSAMRRKEEVRWQARYAPVTAASASNPLRLN